MERIEIAFKSDHCINNEHLHLNERKNAFAISIFFSFRCFVLSLVRSSVHLYSFAVFIIFIHMIDVRICIVVAYFARPSTVPKKKQTILYFDCIMGFHSDINFV